MQIIFKSIKNEDIFEPDFQNLTAKEGVVKFKHLSTSGGIAVVYAPNGTGKSSLAKVLMAEKTSNQMFFVAENDAGDSLIPESKAFHVILDQINRNVIGGKETDYLIGKQIRREYELRANINNCFETAYSALGQKYKNEYKVSKVGDYLLTQIGSRGTEKDNKAFEYIRSIVNNRVHGKDISQEEFLQFIRNKNNIPVLHELDKDKEEWVILDSSKSKILEKVINIDWHTIMVDTGTIEIERHDDAIEVLKKYHELDYCVVCDNHDFNGNDLLTKKAKNRKRIYDSLDKKTKELLDNVVRDSSLKETDPFNIKPIIGKFIAGEESVELQRLQKELELYIKNIENKMIVALFHCFDGTDLFRDYDEYMELISTQPQLDSEELLFIEDVINENIGKDITIVRDSESKNYKLKIGDKNLLGIDRNEMELSSGEQNFISLAFELLMARHSNKEYVVLDDPISSFDSVYKNKITFCIIKFLEDKKQIVLTHNTDLIRLLDVQRNNCFNLYILNNVENGQNGFIPVSEQEKKLLINLHELVKLFQNKGGILISAIRNRRQFLMSIIPFLRGYAHISLDLDDYFGRLSDIMHGYCNGSLDIIPIYQKFFNYDFGGQEIISVEDVLNLDCSSIDILDDEKLPLLSSTLKQSLIYYHLRMKVEHELVNTFKITACPMDTLNDIIRKAFKCDESSADFEIKRKYRVFFTSRKTLLNEFNHFEGNMNIFQPAIDINPAALQKEIDGIEEKLVEVRSFANGT